MFVSICQVEYTTPHGASSSCQRPDKSLYTLYANFWTNKMEISELKQFMQLALEQARLCGTDVPIGALIINSEKKLISTGFNQRESKQDPLGHAELIAIRSAAQSLGSWRLQNCTIFSTLEPCPMCAEAIIQSRIKRVVFGAYDLIAGAAGSSFNLFIDRKALPVPEVLAGVLEQECSTLLKEFFKQQRKR